MIDELKERVRHVLNLRQRAYQFTFSSQSGKAVLKDLARFCRATETTFEMDPRLHAALEGRREVFLRIMKHTGLSTAELWAQYGVPHERDE